MIKHTKTVQAFNELASHYEETVDEELRKFWGWNYSDFVDQLIRRIPLEHIGSVLDVATGTGLIPRKIAQTLHQGSRIVGLDLTFLALNHARQKNKADPQLAPIHFVQASADSMPFASGSFDGVICALATHHIGQANFLDQVCGVLKEGGWLVLADVAASPSWKRPGVSLLLRLAAFFYFLLMESPARAWIESEAVSNVYTVDEWMDALRRVGFADIASTRLDIKHSWAPRAMIITAKKSVCGAIR